jgi:hypothetical protein
MPDFTVSANVDTLMQSATFANFRSNLGLTSLATTTPGTGIAAALAVNANAGGGLIVLADPGADRIPFWDDSAGAFTFLTIGAGLSITGTTLDATASANVLTAASAAASAGLLWTSGGADRSAVATDTVNTLNATTATAGALNFSRTLGTDDTYHGIGITGINAGATIAQWETVYYDFAAGEWLLADANGVNTFPAQGLAVAAGTDGNALTVMVQGIVRNDAWAWSAGPIYLSTTAGGLTQTAPSTSGDKVQVVGFALTADVAYFNFNTTYLTVA